MKWNERLGNWLMDHLPVETEREAKWVLIAGWFLFLTIASMVYAQIAYTKYTVVANAYNDLQLCGAAIEVYKPGISNSNAFHPTLRRLSVSEREQIVREYCRGHVNYTALKHELPLYFEEE